MITILLALSFVYNSDLYVCRNVVYSVKLKKNRIVFDGGDTGWVGVGELSRGVYLVTWRRGNFQEAIGTYWLINGEIVGYYATDNGQLSEHYKRFK